MELTQAEITRCIFGLILTVLMTKFVLAPVWKWVWKTKISKFFIFSGYKKSMQLLSGQYANFSGYNWEKERKIGTKFGYTKRGYFFLFVQSLAKFCTVCLLLTLLFYRPFADGICYKTANYEVGDVVVYEHELKEIIAFDENIMGQKTAILKNMEFQPSCSSIQGIYTEDDMDKSEAYRLFKSYICGVSYIMDSAQNGISTLLKLAKE